MTKIAARGVVAAILVLMCFITGCPTEPDNSSGKQWASISFEGTHPFYIPDIEDSETIIDTAQITKRLIIYENLKFRVDILSVVATEDDDNLAGIKSIGIDDGTVVTGWVREADGIWTAQTINGRAREMSSSHETVQFVFNSETPNLRFCITYDKSVDDILGVTLSFPDASDEGSIDELAEWLMGGYYTIVP